MFKITLGIEKAKHIFLFLFLLYMHAYVLVCNCQRALLETAKIAKIKINVRVNIKQIDRFLFVIKWETIVQLSYIIPTKWRRSGLKLRRGTESQRRAVSVGLPISCSQVM